jgi:hypothetical protein
MKPITQTAAGCLEALPRAITTTSGPVCPDAPLCFPRRTSSSPIAILIASLALSTALPAGAGVVISEVMYDTVGVESGSTVGEWVEVFNTGPGSVDMTNWQLEKDNAIDGAGADRLALVQGPATLGPGQFALIVPGGDAAASTAPLLETWHIPPLLTVFSCNWTGARNLNNSGETIALRDAAGALVDQVAIPDLGANLGSVQVVISAIDTGANDSAANWAQSTTNNASYCESPVSVNGADFGYFDNVLVDDFWDGPEELRDLGTPGRFPTHLKYSTRYQVDYGAPLVSTRDQVRAAVISGVIVPSLGATNLCAYDLPAPFPAGTTVSAAEGHAPVLVLPSTTWVVWLDDDPQSEFSHPARLVLVDDATLAIEVVNTGWWPEMNWEPYFGTEEERLCSTNKFWGACCPTTPPPAAAVLPPPLLSTASLSPAAAGNKACAIGISGSKEPHFTKNVDNFLKALADKGLVTTGRTKKVLYPKSTLKNICKALEDLPKDCDKVYVYVASHGSKNSISLPGTDLSAKKLACKLKDMGAPSYCIVVQACHSGSLIDELKGKKVPGLVTTSADTNNTSKFKPNEYSFYTKYIIDCLKQPAITNLKSAAAWAKEQHKKERPKDKANPQCADLAAVVSIKNDDLVVPEGQCLPAGQPFNFLFETEDPPPGPIAWSLAAPGLAPPALNLGPGGLLSGELVQPGQFDFVVQITGDDLPEPVSLPYSLCVRNLSPTAPPLLTVDTELAPALVGQPYRSPLWIRGGQPPYNVQIVHASAPLELFIIPSGPQAGMVMAFPETTAGAELTVRVSDSGVPMPQVALRNLSFSAVERSPAELPTLTIRLEGASVLVTWDDPSAQLLQAPEVNGPWSPVLGATSPHTVPHLEAPRLFFQLQSD